MLYKPQDKEKGIIMSLKQHSPLILLEAMLLLSLLVLDRPLIRGDAVAYFMWTASIGRDLDMNLENQAERFGELNTYNGNS